jgi:hypothetical protein
MEITLKRLWVCCCVLCLPLHSGLVVAAPLDAPAAAVVSEARRLVQEMIQDSRGPYSRIRWYCNDGTSFKPVPYACAEHGGGRQHAEYSAKRTRLAELGWSVGTIFAATSFEELSGDNPRRIRLRELALERYLTDIDDGWVLRRARDYRGRVQLEDEVVAGRELLLTLLKDSDWLDDNYLLMRELVRIVPHGEETDLSRRVQRAAVELAELAPAAERFRAEIHSAPNAATAAKLRSWADSIDDANVRATALALADDLDRLYGEAGREERLTAALRNVRKMPKLRPWHERVRGHLDSQSRQRVGALCGAMAEARAVLLPNLTPAERLAMMSAMTGLETEARLAFASELDAQAWSRVELLELGLAITQCGYASGLISAGEMNAVREAIEVGADSTSLRQYQIAINMLKRVPAWAAASVRYHFAEALIRYTALDSRSTRFVDDLLRGSPLWMLGDILRMLSQDLGELAGVEVELDGQRVNTAIALNQGLARGRLRIYETLEAAESASFQMRDIVVLPETLAELKPVAGILTLGEGNALSHVQLLARNFGIPNVAIDQQTVDLIRPLEGRDVVLIVGPAGNVIFREMDKAGAVEELFALRDEPGSAQIEVPTPDLRKTDILPLKSLKRSLSGKVVGPKAANLGQLNRLFPGRVAPAVAIPFGVYARELEAAGLMQRIRNVYDDRKLDGEARLTELGAIREGIAGLRLSDEAKRAIETAMAQEFGALSGYGVFLRSDTNVEDLPEFTGAGLSETVPNVVGLDAQLATVPRVWASVLSPRALTWRSSLLSNPEQVYASVLLMKSVPSDKSGVLVTANLIDPQQTGLTVSAAWGVGGAVAGEAAESRVILPQSTRLVSEAKSAYRRKLSDSGGIEWLPASAGRVLQDDEIQQLRDLAQEVAGKYTPVLDENGLARPWDIEFGFVDGRLTLFQIRPLVEKGAQRAARGLLKLRPSLVYADPDTQVDMRQTMRRDQP